MTSIDAGVNFPLVHGSRSSTATGKQILAAAVRTAEPALADRIEHEPDWRQSYPQYFTEVTALEGRSSALALDVARAGLAAAREAFVVEPGDAAAEEGIVTHEVRGKGPRVPDLVVPYEGVHLQGDDLLRQLDDWVSRGIAEPSFATAVGAVVRNPGWLDLSDRTVALVGAGAEMGPFRQLMAWGATVAAVDLPRPAVWEKLRDITLASPGRLLAPVRDPEATDWTTSAGANLLTEFGLLGDWLAGLPGPMVLGNYGYADGPLFVRLSVAFDLLVTELAAHRDDLSLAYLATPSDAFLVPAEAVAESQRRYDRLSPSLPANYAGAGSRSGGYGLVNAFIAAQGQNYGLAKRLQRWRMAVARSEGVLTSVHVAPPTRTRSVHSNPEMERRQRLGAHLGLETFDAATSQALAAAILVHDLRNPRAAANPGVALAHPHEIFMFAANPGGRWRIPLDPNAAVPVLEAREHAGEPLGDWAGLLRPAARR